MITVKLFTQNGSVVKVQSCGHSNLAESGNDILCAAVSTLVQTAYLALCDIYGKLSYTKRDGYFEFPVPSGHDGQVVINVLRVGISDLSSGFPQNLKLEEA